MNLQLLTIFAIVGVAMASDFRVTVGISQITGQVGTGLDPNRIVPSAGDTITFSWLIPSYIQNPQTGTYSVTQGTYDAPCKPMGGGFDSGPKTTGPESAGQAPTMTFQVKDDKPLYFFSSVDDQCKRGMVLGVNSPATGVGSVEAYITAAGGNPNADTTTSGGSAPSAPSSTNTTAATTPKTNTTSSSSSTASKQPVNSGSTNSSSAKPQNSAAETVVNPQSLLTASALLSTAYFL
ncbi:hypothetical protein MJO28_000682 [Puccinia striiformis f. sp. tritici]|uniref:Phytocyanin domain-containing protein n=4 Tax=Puccinia striiformis TaxID=27350 RepID=A0A2S4W2G6_9BASI|nr:hypothetical protein Pst134EA_000564 [Puccinia striiformis f. sp. tritici]POW04000.1 hypothetical protein PSTT_10713 [Puccinia striiformis]KAH9473489.1 hypothetical protein Pst134EA_000564 [Puccinia striiformis f. sp. tritici]KAI7962587.1 hypothetical protein MJO28_000681 [Puccinia striiformis f. sp. tritici]KAI7962588.1 hypothetical protein MJO28_000682 [Puccinia striiformis f. sp. tritici]KAI7967291.1 hypothetical protein MJO29_000568 [Puccinia striiformis f. sp. tritici]